MLSRVDQAKRTKHVGILIHDKANLYSNGITQNAYFIYQCLERAGMKCRFLCQEDTPSKFDYNDIPLYKISTNALEFDPSEYHTVMTVTRSLSKEQYEFLKKHNVFVVAFVCGNTFMHNLEDFIRGPLTPGTSTYIGRSSPCDELWLIPSYAHSLEYVSLIRGRPTFLIPHLWAPHLMIESAMKFNKIPESEMLYNYANHVGKKIDILILEPNMAIFKTCWVPIVAGEKLFIEDETILENIYAFNFPTHNNSYAMTDNLRSDKIIRKFKRLTIYEILSHFNKKGSFPVIVSHQILNSLNYLYYEALYFGWPLVHNSPDLDGCGYYYPENNISACVEAIRKAYTMHNKTSKEYLERGREYLRRVDPLDATMHRTWDGMISTGIAKSLASSEA